MPKQSEDFIHVCIPPELGDYVDVPVITDEQADGFFNEIEDYFYRQGGYLKECIYCGELFPFFPFGIRYGVCNKEECIQKDVAQGEICKAKTAQKKAGLQKEKERKKAEKLNALAAQDDTSNERRSGIIYLLSGENGLYKIGITRGDLSKRIKNIQDMSPVPVRLLNSIKSMNAHGTEMKLHNSLGRYRKHGEWFSLPSAIVERFLAIHDYDLDKGDLDGFWTASGHV